MQIARSIAALVGLGTIGFALGDFASHPNPLGALALLALMAAIAFLLSFLFRPARTPRAGAPAAIEEPRERPGRARSTPVWSGWEAQEAQTAREQRRERRRG